MQFKAVEIAKSNSKSEFSIQLVAVLASSCREFSLHGLALLSGRLLTCRTSSPNTPNDRSPNLA
jgi:hypothetical protein